MRDNCSICPVLLSQLCSGTGSECTLTEIQLLAKPTSTSPGPLLCPRIAAPPSPAAPKWLRWDFNSILLAPLCAQLQARGREQNFLPKRKSGVFVVKKQMMDHTQPEAHEQLLEMPRWYHPPPVSTPAPGRRVIKGSREMQEPAQHTAPLEMNIQVSFPGFC